MFRDDDDAFLLLFEKCASHEMSTYRLKRTIREQRHSVYLEWRDCFIIKKKSNTIRIKKEIT